MMDLGVVPRLLDLLEQHVDEGDLAVQNAGLSALRNLAIPAANKARMFEDGVTERVKNLLQTDMPPLHFKLLATLRMVVDGQEPAACVLGTDEELLARLVCWCQATDPGVKGESSRLLAAFITHSNNPAVVCTAARADGIRQLMAMATSEHAIMQNEALVALSIASAVDIESVKGTFKEADLVPILKKLLEEPEGSVEVKINALGLIYNLANAGVEKQDIDLVDLKESLNKLTNHSNSELASQASSLLPSLCDDS